ncbi:MAG: hypothetical protein PUJ42_09310 [Bacteroidales bacterium]|nr:hypothetical protein [Bacteroidales bacterium]
MPWKEEEGKGGYGRKVRKSMAGGRGVWQEDGEYDRKARERGHGVEE